MAFCACIDKDGFWAQNPKSRESILAQLPEIATFYRDEQIVLEESQDERGLCLSQFVWNCCKNGYPVFESNMEAIKDSGWMHRLFYWETGKFGHLVKVWKHTHKTHVFFCLLTTIISMKNSSPREYERATRPRVKRPKDKTVNSQDFEHILAFAIRREPAVFRIFLRDHIFKKTLDCEE